MKYILLLSLFLTGCYVEPLEEKKQRYIVNCLNSAAGEKGSLSVEAIRECEEQVNRTLGIKNDIK